MATVYEATDLRLDRPVAVKVMPHALSDDENFSQRFVREARAAARLTHPNVVTVYDQGDDDGVLFLAMEYVPGRHTLRDVIRDDAPLPPVRALALLEEILKAIAAAHEAGIIHRDIKPENVLIDRRGQLKVADFGLARAISAATAATATSGVLMGTVSYLPPELVTDGTADARSDVYAVGVLAFELLTGTKPHSGDSPIQVAYKHVNIDVPAPSSVVGSIPAYLDAFVARATSRRRDLRPADAHVMLQQLRRVRQAIDSGVIDDQELTDDLTPTVALAASPAARAAAHAGATAASASPGGPPSRDEVFDCSVYDDFSRSPAQDSDAGLTDERTLMVGGLRAPAGRTTDRGHLVDQPSGSTASGGLASGSMAADSMAAGSTPPDPMATGSTQTDSMATGSTQTDSTLAGYPGERPSQPRPGPTYRRRKRGWVVLFVVLLLAAGAAMAGWYYGVGRFRSTPDVISFDQARARSVVQAAGLTFQISRTVYSETVPPGDVISTDPRAGDDVLKNHGTVSAVVSKGPERHAMPVLTGLSEADAIKLVTDNALTVGHTTRAWSNTLSKGQVISSTPSPGTQLHRGDPVRMVVSQGPEPLTVDDHVGDDAATARKQLSKIGFDVSTTREYDDAVDKGKVISQRPDHGVRHLGDPIALVVSRGPHLVEVPDVDTFGLAAAESALRDRGFAVTTTHFDPYLGLEFVVGESPGAGQLAPYGSTVVLTVV